MKKPRPEKVWAAWFSYSRGLKFEKPKRCTYRNKKLLLDCGDVPDLIPNYWTKDGQSLVERLGQSCIEDKYEVLGHLAQEDVITFASENCHEVMAWILGINMTISEIRRHLPSAILFPNK